MLKKSLNKKNSLLFGTFNDLKGQSFRQKYVTSHQYQSLKLLDKMLKVFKLKNDVSFDNF